MVDRPIICTLTPDERATRREALLPGLVTRADGVERLPDGYRLRFAAAPALLADIAGVIDAERQCCRFLRFELRVEPDLGPTWLTLTGPSGTTEMLGSLFE